MPHFYFDTNEDGSIRQIYRDGQPHNESVTLESVYSIVTPYFRLAASNLSQMTAQTSSDERRLFGMQSFLMSLTGLEAFTNTFFHLRGITLNRGDILSRVDQSHGSLSRKIEDLIELAPERPIEDQENLIARVHALSQMRNVMVHPRWTPSSMTMGGTFGLAMDGLVENPQSIFENEQYCREALNWCLLVIARIGQASGVQNIGGFLFHWTGVYGLALSMILTELDLPNQT